MQYTTIEQSKRLVELGLSIKTADLVLIDEGDGEYRLGVLNNYDGLTDEIPAWSVEALLKVIPCPYQMTRGIDGKVQFTLLTVSRDDTFDTELEAVYTMVIWLLENDLLDPIKLRNYDSQRAD